MNDLANARQTPLMNQRQYCLSSNRRNRSQRIEADHPLTRITCPLPGLQVNFFETPM